MTRKLQAVLDLDSGQFTMGLRVAGQRLHSFSGQINGLNVNLGQSANQMRTFQKSMHGPIQMLRDWTLILGEGRHAMNLIHSATTGWVVEMVKASAEMQRMGQMMKGMSSGLTEAERVKDVTESMKALTATAQNAPFSIKSLGDAFIKLKSGGVDPLDGSLQGLVDGVAAFGGTSDTLHRAAIAIQQMSGKGVISMEELRQQLGEAVPNAMQMMARGMSMTMRDLNKAVSDGKVTAENALKKMSLQFNVAFGGSAQRMMQTFSGQLELARTNWQIFASTVMGVNNGVAQTGGFLFELTAQMKVINHYLSSTDGKDFAKNIGDSLVVILRNLADAIKWIIKYKAEIILFGKVFAAVLGGKLVTGAIANMVTSWKALFPATTAATGAASAFSGALKGLITGSGTLTSRFLALGSSIGGARGAVSILARVVGFAFGPGGWLVLLASALLIAANRYGLFASKANEAAEAQARFKRGEVNQEDSTTMSTRVADIEGSYLWKRTHNTDGTRKEMPKMHSVPVWNQMMKDIEPLERERAGLIKDAAGVRLGVSTRAVMTSFDRWEQTVSTRVEDIQKTANDKVMGLQKSLEGGKITSSEFEESKKKIQKASLTSILSRLDINIKAMEDSLNLPVNRNNVATQKGIREGIDRLKAQRVQFGETSDRYDTVSALDDGIVPGKGGGGAANGGAAGQARELLSEYKSLYRDVMVLEARINGSSVNAAKVAADVATAALKKGSATRAEVDALVRQKDTLEPLWEQMDDIKTRSATVGEILDKMAVDTKDAGGEFQDAMDWLAGGATEAERKLLRLQQRFENALDPISEFKAKLESDRDIAVSSSKADPRLILELNNQIATQELRLTKGKAEAADRARITQGVAAAQTFRNIDEELNKWQANLRGVDAERAYNHAKELERFEVMKQQILDAGNVDIATQQRIANAKVMLDQRQKFENLGPIGTQLQTMADSMGNIKSLGATALDGFNTALEGGSQSMRRFAKDMVKQLIMIIIRAMIAKAILSALGMGMGGGSGPNADIMAGNVSTGADFQGMAFKAPQYHTGGIVGTAAHTRMMTASMISTAARYHTGRAPTLRAGEVPAVLKADEGVFTPEQMAALGRGGSANAAPKTTINFINNSGTQLDADQGESRFDGEGYVLDIVIEAMNRPGRARDAFKSMK